MTTSPAGEMDKKLLKDLAWAKTCSMLSTSIFGESQLNQLNPMTNPPAVVPAIFRKSLLLVAICVFIVIWI